MTLPPATISSVPIRDYAEANVELASKFMKEYFTCCGKSICRGCVNSFCRSENMGKCPFCKAETLGKTDEERVQEMMKRVEANDAASICLLGNYYYRGNFGLPQDLERAIALWKQAAKLGSSEAQYNLGTFYNQGGDSKKAKFHYEAAAMAGHEAARYYLGCMEFESGDKERAVKHWEIAASAGDYKAMHNLLGAFNHGVVSRESIDSTLTAYNTSCVEMRSEARDTSIQIIQERE
jgi:TPR repeat protein